MQIEICTKSKTIVIKGTYTIQELMNTLLMLCPDLDWEKEGWKISDKLPAPVWIDMSQWPGQQIITTPGTIPYTQPWNPLTGGNYYGDPLPGQTPTIVCDSNGIVIGSGTGSHNSLADITGELTNKEDL